MKAVAAALPPGGAMAEAAAVVIGTRACSACPLCGGDGDVLHAAQADRLFGAPGRWRSRRCRSRQCRLIWLDPMPLASELPKAYARYYTHAAAAPPPAAGSLPRRLLAAMKRQYLRGVYGYDVGRGSLLGDIAGRLLACCPGWRADADGQVRLLPASPGARLLDVGCGSGEFMLTMQRLGWHASGVDLDAQAVAVCRRQGLAVRPGTLEAQSFASASFDAITLNHVIEHVPDPVATLRECRRLLKPGGRLVLFTPNGDSLGHRFFGPAWRGLEPPRHVHVFAFASMRLALRQAGFDDVALLPWPAESLIRESVRLRWGLADGQPAGGRWSTTLATRAFFTLETLLVLARPDAADCLAAIALAPAAPQEAAR